MPRLPGPAEFGIVVWIAVLAAVIVWPAGRICRRVGYSPWLGLLSVIPLANIVLLWFVATAEWPAARRT